MNDTHNTLKRDNLPPCTRKMRAVLAFLCAAKRADEPYQPLDGVHPKTIRSLVERDWIAESDGLDGVKYTVTGRGLKAHQVYAAPNRYRSDGMCPRCGKKPRGVRRSGKRKPYCTACERAASREEFARNGPRRKAETPCPRCHKRPRHVFPSGKATVYCTHCRKVLRRRERQRKMKRKLWLVSIGRPPICLKCDKAVYHTAKTVYDYCYAHYYEYHNEYQKRYQREHRAARKAGAA